jgi:cyclopropane fatty-acyl-phospholipid synthase-like methyltransferase
MVRLRPSQSDVEPLTSWTRLSATANGYRETLDLEEGTYGMKLSAHAQRVSTYYDAHTGRFYIDPGRWDREHIHLGVFLDRDDQEYRHDPMKVRADRTQAVLRMTEAIVSPANLGEADTVVDAGCGVGGTCIYVARTYGSSVTGLNINEMQLEIARARSCEAGLDGRGCFLLCDCTRRLPFDDCSVNAIINIEAACHFNDRRFFLCECARVLKSRGRIVAQDWMVAACISSDERRDFVSPLCQAWHLSELDSLSSYCELLGAVGLEVEEAEHLDGILPNGYLIRLVYEALIQKEVAQGLTDYEARNKDRLRTFADSLLGGQLKVGRYSAVKAQAK